MTKLNEIDAQIEALKLKKKKIQTQEAQDLHKSLSSLLVEQFSPALILGIVVHALKQLKDKPDLKEEWLKASPSFQKSKSDFSKKNKKD